MGRKRDRNSSVVTSTDVARLAQVSQTELQNSGNPVAEL